MSDDLPTSAACEAQPGTSAGVTPASPPGYEVLDEVGRGGMDTFVVPPEHWQRT